MLCKHKCDTIRAEVQQIPRADQQKRWHARFYRLGWISLVLIIVACQHRRQGVLTVLPSNQRDQRALGIFLWSGILNAHQHTQHFLLKQVFWELNLDPHGFKAHTLPAELTVQARRDNFTRLYLQQQNRSSIVCVPDCRPQEAVSFHLSTFWCFTLRPLYNEENKPLGVNQNTLAHNNTALVSFFRTLIVQSRHKIRKNTNLPV